MRLATTIALTLVLIASAKAEGRTVASAERSLKLSDINGEWHPFNGSGNRTETFRLVDNNIIIEAQDLDCTLTNLKVNENNPAYVEANGECHDEGFTSYTKEALTLINAGRKIYLIESAIPLVTIDHDAQPTSHTNDVPMILTYEKQAN